MTQVIVMHRAYTNPQGDWYPWLKATLEEKRFQVSVPSFPSHRSPRLPTWVATCAKTLNDMDSETVVVAHDIGVVTTLRTIQARLPQLRLRGMVTVAGQCQPIEHFGLLNRFFPDYIDWALLRAALGRVVVLNDEDDPLAPLTHGQKIALELGAELVVTKGRGHFSGTTLPEVLEALDQILAASHEAPRSLL